VTDLAFPLARRFASRRTGVDSPKPTARPTTEARGFGPPGRRGPEEQTVTTIPESGTVFMDASSSDQGKTAG
jgi:hypothetical protein